MRDDDRAVQDFTLVLHHNPENTLALGARALIHLRLGRTQEALVDFSKALECAPDSASLYYNRGLAYAEQGCLHEAIDDHTRCLGLEPHNAEAWNNRGAAYAAREDYNQAICDFNRALDIELGHADALENRAAALQQRRCHFVHRKFDEEVRYVSNRTGKRDIIRTLDAHEDFYELFGERNGEDSAPEPSCEEEEPFSRMLEDALSGVDQAAIIRQKYPEHVQVLEQQRISPRGTLGAELDLHGCHVREALVRVEAFLETAGLRARSGPHYCGQGLHSQGSAVLPDAVEGKIVELKRRGRVATFAWEKKTQTRQRRGDRIPVVGHGCAGTKSTLFFLKLLKNAHLLRCAHHSSLRRTEEYASFLIIACRQVSQTARALHLCVFEQPV